MMLTLKNIITNQLYEELSNINKNFFNLKHELFIRNTLVCKYNANSLSNEIAVAEYPKKKGAVDMSLIKDDNVRHRIEFKYQYPKDLTNNSVIESLLKDTNLAKDCGLCTDFILVIHERSENIKTYSNAGIKPIYTELNDKFSDNCNNLLEFEKQIERGFSKEMISIEIFEPYQNIYHFIIYKFDSFPN